MSKDYRRHYYIGLQDDSKKNEKSKSLKLHNATTDAGMLKPDNTKEQVSNSFSNKMQLNCKKQNDSKHSSKIPMNQKLNANFNNISRSINECEDVENRPNNIGTQYFNEEGKDVPESLLHSETFTENTVGLEMVVCRSMEHKNDCVEVIPKSSSNISIKNDSEIVSNETRQCEDRYFCSLGNSECHTKITEVL